MAIANQTWRQCQNSFSAWILSENGHSSLPHSSSRLALLYSSCCCCFSYGGAHRLQYGHAMHPLMHVRQASVTTQWVSPGNCSSPLDTRVAHLIYFSYAIQLYPYEQHERASGQPKSGVTIFLLTNPIKTTPDHQMLRIYTSRAPAHMAQMLPGFSAGLNTLFCMTMPIVVVVVCCHHHHRLQLHPWHPNMLLWTSTDVVVVLYMCVN